MPSEQLHTIRRLRFETRCSDEQWALGFRQQVTSSILPELETVFAGVCTEIVGEDELLVVERLEVDLGIVSPDAMPGDVLSRLRERLRGALHAQRHRVSVAELRQANERLGFERLLYVLETGTLPWWAPSESFVLSSEMLTIENASLRALIGRLQLAGRGSRAWERMALRLDDSVIAAVIASSPELTAALSTLRTRLSQLRVSDPDTFVAVWPTEPEVARAIVRLGGAVLSGMDIDRVSALMVLEWVSGSEGGSLDVRSDRGVAAITVIETIFALPSGSLLLEETRDSGRLPVAAAASSVGAAVRSEWRDDEIEVFTTNSAGLVIAAVYLPTFFARLRLTLENEFRSLESQLEAVQLLGYLSYGRDDVEEHLLVAEKVWCGLDVHTPVPVCAPLSDERKAQCDELLHAIIENWSVLKNTSIEGLRQTFLRRQGLLERRERSWLLRIERHTVDVLLDRLPWGISHITLPWMPIPMEVEW